MPTSWPPLPDQPRAGCAYGLLQVRRNERLRHSVLARVDLDTGELRTEDYLSRDCYDWTDESVEFRVYRSTQVFEVDEGTTSEFVLDEEDLGAVAGAWAQYQNRLLERATPRARGQRRSPRI